MVVAIIDMVRDHYAVSDEKLTRSEQSRLNQQAFVDSRTCDMKQVTSPLGVSCVGEDEKCSVDAV